MEFWAVLGEMAPYLLFGFLFAGVLSVLVSPALVERHLGGSGLWPVVKAAVFGIPLPLCSCGVIPVGASLRAHGASRAATTSFLLSTPQTGIDSILVTYSLLGPVFAVFRPVAALVNGLIGGAAVALLAGRHAQGSTAANACDAPCCSGDSGGNVVTRIFKYGLITLPRDISKSLLIGLVVAGVIAAVVPDDFFAGLLGAGIGSMLVMLLLGIPIYVCATASVPVAAALIAKGVTPGAALVFLMTGPSTNAATVATIWKIMVPKTAVIYLASVAVTALASGIALDAFFSMDGVSFAVHSHEMLPGWVGTVSAVVLLGVIGLSLLRPVKAGPADVVPAAADGQMATLEISGMTCNHCVQSVQRAVQECPGVLSAEVALSPGRAEVRGKAFDVEAVRRAVEGLGFRVQVGPSSIGQGVH
ncbi:MAG: SO_0444 family Cu/Zn efflux transporter [Phycisphaerae bacterium]|nr:SO_0444 family Cu/Zn efflux transporter [Phycisphaerae bacterium]